MSRQVALLRRKWERKYVCSENPDKGQEDLGKGESAEDRASSGMGQPECGPQRMHE